MIKKYGITLTMLAVTIVIMGILATVITSSIYSSINFSRLSTWANEIEYIKNVLNEKMSRSSSLDVSLGSISIDLSELSNEEMEEQFEGETIENSQVELDILDLGKLGISNTTYGNKRTANDVYAYSETTSKVYYVEGVKINGKTYYTMADSLFDMFEISRRDSSLTTVVFVPSVIGYTNEAVSVTVKVPSAFTGVTVTTSNNNILIGAATINGNVNEYLVNTSDVTGNYTITVTYTNEEQEYTSTYEVNGYDDEDPVLSIISINNNICKLSVTDNVNIAELKYIEGEIAGENIESYFENKGNKILNQKFRYNDNIDKYTIYTKDYAGNYDYTILNINTNRLLVSFDANGGSVSINSKYVYYNNRYGELPTPTRTGYTFVGWSYSSLPSEYQQVEYIQSTGTQYIDVAFNPDQNTRTVIDFQFVSGYSSGRIFGVRNSYTSRAYFLSLSTATGGTPFANYGTQNVMGTVNDTNSRQLWDFNKNKFYVNETLLKTFNIESFTTAESAILFGAKNLSQTPAIGLTKAKVYSCKIYDNDILIRDFIPCYRKSDNEAGMYDKVNDIFYTNPGTGSFTLGNFLRITQSTSVSINSDHTLTAIWRENT